MRRKLFIGSSSEGLSIAKQLKEKINTECGDWIETEIWNEGGVFSLNKNALDSLLKASRKFDYGILVATNDDIVKSRGIEKIAPRDNVMLEMGMFLGSLGLTRAFLMVEESGKLPTDYNGVTVPFFQKDIEGSLEKAIDKIIEAFNTTKSSYNLKPVPSTALALGYFDNFIQPLAQKRLEQNIDFRLEILLPKNLKDIHSEKLAYKNTNESIEVSVYDDGSRPLVFEHISKQHSYWDIPTTLTTLAKLMDILLPSHEIGVNQEKQDWIEHELRSFSGTIKVLVEQCTACKGKITVINLK
jgi:hypothetical protein